MEGLNTMSEERSRIATRAYYHHINRSGWNWTDSLSNWAQSEREERLTTGRSLETDTWRLRVPFRLHIGSKISDIGLPRVFQARGVSVTLSRSGERYVLDAGPFSSETEAEHFFWRILGGLTWAAFELHLPIIRESALSSTTMAPDPSSAARNLANATGLAISPPLDGIASLSEPLILPEWAVIRYTNALDAAVEVSTDPSQLVDALLHGIEATDLTSVVLDTKLQLAIELFLGYFREVSMRARLLALVMSLEALKTGELKPPAAQQFLDKWASELQAERKKLPETSPERSALNSLEKELLFRRELSIMAQVRGVVRRALEEVGDTELAISEAIATFNAVYEARSRLVHDGDLPPDQLSVSVQQAFQLVRRVLRARLQSGIATSR